jgi:hypothetical protein
MTPSREEEPGRFLRPRRRSCRRPQRTRRCDLGMGVGQRTRSRVHRLRPHSDQRPRTEDTGTHIPAASSGPTARWTIEPKSVGRDKRSWHGPCRSNGRSRHAQHSWRTYPATMKAMWTPRTLRAMSQQGSRKRPFRAGASVVCTGHGDAQTDGDKDFAAEQPCHGSHPSTPIACGVTPFVTPHGPAQRGAVLFGSADRVGLVADAPSPWMPTTRFPRSVRSSRRAKGSCGRAVPRDGRRAPLQAEHPRILQALSYSPKRTYASVTLLEP